MADDQATLGSFAGSDSDDDGEDDPEPEAEDGPREPSEDEEDDGSGNTVDTAADPTFPSNDPVCPWCLAPADEFVDRGLTGRACGRCAAALPVDADWFRGGGVVARRPMYEVDDDGA